MAEAAIYPGKPFRLPGAEDIRGNRQHLLTHMGLALAQVHLFPCQLFSFWVKGADPFRIAAAKQCCGRSQNENDDCEIFVVYGNALQKDCLYHNL